MPGGLLREERLKPGGMKYNISPHALLALLSWLTLGLATSTD